ncbi:MAG: (2Fe-2S)-binding protein [Clostridiales bacterium]|nr:(2Fe-2S)-binding protein [Clostridiales bacterium]
MDKQVTITINGLAYQATVDTTMTLLQFIRDEAGLTGTKSGCENGECGACTVLLNGKPVRSCIILALEADGAEILTVEGIATDGALHPLQQAFIDHSAVQCGFCIPGMLVASKALLGRYPNPSETQVMEALGGHLCRCGGYKAMSEAIQSLKQ